MLKCDEIMLEDFSTTQSHSVAPIGICWQVCRLGPPHGFTSTSSAHFCFLDVRAKAWGQKARSQRLAHARARRSQLKPLPLAPAFVKALWQITVMEPDVMWQRGEKNTEIGTRGFFSERACASVWEAKREYGTSESHILCWHVPTHLERPVVPLTWQLSSAFWVKLPAAMWEFTHRYMCVCARVCLHIQFNPTNMEKMQHSPNCSVLCSVTFWSTNPDPMCKQMRGWTGRVMMRTGRKVGGKKQKWSLTCYISMSENSYWMIFPNLIRSWRNPFATWSLFSGK